MTDYLDALRSYATPRDAAAYAGLDQGFGRRLAAMLERAPEHVRRPDLIESLYRDNEAQARAIRSVAQRLGIPFTPMLLARGIPGYAAPVGGSRHQSGQAADLNWSRLPPEAQGWLRSNAGAYGLRFPLGNTDPGHIEFDPDWRGELPGQRPMVSGLPASPPPIMDTAMMGLGVTRPEPERSVPPIVSYGMRAFRDGGRVEDALKIAAQQTERNPSDAQKESGRYKKGTFSWNGLKIAIENPKGSTRSGVDKNGNRWKCTLPATYGFVRGTEAVDGDAVDCYVGPDHDSDKVFVIDQIDAETKKYDEPKCFLDFASKEEVLSTYRKAFSDGKADQRIGAVTEMSVDEFRKWVGSPKATKKPIGEFARGGTVAMPKSSHSTALDIARRYNGGRVGYEDGGVPLGPIDWTPETERRAEFGPAAPVASSANTPLGDLLARYTGSVDVGRSATNLENFSRDFAGVTDAELANSAIERGDIGRAVGHGALAAMLPLSLVRGPVRAAMGARPIMTGLGFGAAGALAEGGADAVGNLLSSPAQAQETTPAPTSNLPMLLQQYDRAGAEVRRLRSERDAQRPRGRTLDPDRDRIYYNLDEDLKRAQQTQASIGASLQEAQRLESERQGLATRRETQSLEREAEEARRRSPEFLERQRRIDEARGERDRIRADAPLPFRQEFGAVGERWPMAPLVVGATTGLAAALPGTIADRYVNMAWRNALTRAEGGRPLVDRLLGRPAVGRNTVAAREALDTAARYAGRNPSSGGWGPYAAAGGLGFVEGAALPNLQQYYDLTQQPPVNPERTAQEAYYRGLPEDHPDRARTRALLEDELALPRENQNRVGPERFYSSWDGVRTTLGAGLEGAAAALGATTLGRAPRTQQSTRDWMRARTDALSASRPGQSLRPQAPSAPASPLGLGSEPPIPLTPLPPAGSVPGPAGAPLPAGGLAPAPRQLAPPAPEPSARTSAPNLPSPPANSNDPQILTRIRDSRGRTHLQDEQGNFAVNPRSMRQKRLREREQRNRRGRNDTTDEGGDTNRKSGGGVNSALDLANRYAGGGSVIDRLRRLLGFAGRAPQRQFDPEISDAVAAIRRAPEPAPSRTMLTNPPPPSHLTPHDAEQLQGLNGAIRGLEVNQGVRRVQPPSGGDMDLDYLRGLREFYRTDRGTLHADGGMVSRADGGPVAGPILGVEGGRADTKPVKVKSRTYVLPADFVAAVGDGNTNSGFQVIEQTFGAPSPRNFATGGPAEDVDIMISDGEYALSPDQVAKIGGGDIDKGHRILDKVVLQVRQRHIDKLKSLPPPVKG